MIEGKKKSDGRTNEKGTNQKGRLGQRGVRHKCSGYGPGEKGGNIARQSKGNENVQLMVKKQMKWGCLREKLKKNTVQERGKNQNLRV